MSITLETQGKLYIAGLENRIAQLEAELAEARKDQERYRFVRDMTPEDFGNMSTINEEFDSLVDEIIRIEKYHIPNVGKMVQSQAQQPTNIRQIVKNAILSNSHPAENWYLAFNDAEEIVIVSNQVAIALPNDFGDPYKGAREDLAIWKKRALEAESKLQSQAQQTESQWISVEERLPEVEPQDYELFLVSVFSEQTGKTYVFEAGYLNKLEVMSHDTDYTDFTGWYTRSEHPDYDGWYEPIEGDGCKRRVTHWMIKPLPPAPEGDKP